MFSHLTDFSYKRTSLQAFGFYITYLVMVMIFSAAAAVLASMIVREDAGTFSNGVRLGTFVATIFSIALSFVILREKKLTGLGYSLLAITAGALALLGGGLLGLIIPTIFTTKQSVKASKRGKK